jgi:hypothetical protein
MELGAACCGLWGSSLMLTACRSTLQEEQHAQLLRHVRMSHGLWHMLLERHWSGAPITTYNPQSSCVLGLGGNLTHVRHSQHHNGQHDLFQTATTHTMSITEDDTACFEDGRKSA